MPGLRKGRFFAIIMRFMAKKQKFLTAKMLQSLSLGALCAIGAFAMGIETAGDLHPFAKSEAALQELLHVGSDLRGDVNGNGTIDSEDAYLLYEFSEGLETPAADELRRGDTDGDLHLTASDLGYVLHALSTR